MTQCLTIDEILSLGQSGGAIFRAQTSDGRTVRFIADHDRVPRPPVPGEVWRIGGTARRHPTYGLQVHVADAALDRPSGRLIVTTLAKNPSFAGIGPIRAARLWDALGENLYAVLDAGDVSALVPIIGEASAYTAIDAWKSLAIEAELFAWLDRRGITPRIAQKLIDIYGGDVVAKLEENPYRLLAWLNWTDTDRIGRSIGIARDDRRRLVAAVEAAGYQRLEFSHTWTSEAEITASTASLAKIDLELAQAAVDASVADMAVIRVGDGVQGLGPWSMEHFVAERTVEMLSPTWIPAQPRLAQASGEGAVWNILQAFQASAGIRLNVGQGEAVLMAHSAPLSVLAGGAGVGKTTTLQAIVHVSEKLMRPIWQMALSGRAARRMEEATGKPASTIAGFFAKAAAGEIDFTLDWMLVVDEASMLDLPTVYRILRVMRSGQALMLIGDPGQLPPIGFGLTFHALVTCDQIPRVELTEIHRQAASTGIPQAARAIRNGQMPEFMSYVGNHPGVSFIDVPLGAATDRIAGLVAELGGTAAAQVVGVVKRGPAGVRTLNALFHERLGNVATFGGFAAGEPVMWTRNDRDLDLRNGSLGRVTGIDGALSITWDDGRSMELDADMLRHLEHAYAVTCHKAQGSQSRRIVVPVFASRLLDRSLLYTAITRAQEQVVLVGDRRAMAEAIRLPPAAARRQTMMSEMLVVKIQQMALSTTGR